MAGKSTYLENAILNWMKGVPFPAPPDHVWVAVFNGDPTDAGTGGIEVTKTVRSAGRVYVTFGDISNRTITNEQIVDYGNSEGKTDITHFAFYDAASAGNMLHSAALTGGAQTINTTNPVSFAVHALSVAED